MKAYIIAALVGIALISVVSVALAANLGSGQIQNYNNNPSQQTHINRPDVILWDEASGLPMGTTDVSFGIVVREVIITALLAIGSITVLKKK